MRKGKITVDEIIALEKKLETEIYGELFNKWEQDEKYYELDFQAELNLPKEFAHEGIVLPTARDMVDTFVDHIDISNARVFVNRKGTSGISIEEAEMMRKFYLGLIHRTNVESDISPWRVAAKHYALHGLGVFKTVWDADRWPDKPIQREDESDDDYALRIDEWRHETHQSIPIVIQAINPRCMMPDPGYGGRMFVIEKHTKMCLDVTKKWPHWSNPLGKEKKDEVEFISYWDATHRCDLVDGEPILKGGVVKHNYGFIPYVFIDSGLGNISYEAKPEMRYVGMLRYMFDLLVSESRGYSISDVVLKRGAWPWYTIEGENADLVTEIDQLYGKGTRLPTGTKYVPQSPQLPPEALTAHGFRTSDHIASHAAPRSVRGLSEQGVRSGAHYREIMGEAAARYQYSEEAFKNGTAKVLGNCALLFKNVVPGNIRVWTRTPTDEFDMEIKKEAMKEPFNCYVEFKPYSEEDEYRRQQSLIGLIHEGIVTKRWGRQHMMSNVDPLDMEFEEEKQMLRNLPEYMAMKGQILVGKLAEAISKREGAEAIGEEPPITMGETPGVRDEMPGGMVPGIPERARPGSAEEIENQLRALRGRTSTAPMQGKFGGGSRV